MEILARGAWIKQFLDAVHAFDPTLNHDAVRALAAECYPDDMLVPPMEVVASLISLPGDLLRSMVADIVEFQRVPGKNWRDPHSWNAAER